MIWFYDAINSIRGFLELGGDVLYAIMLVLFMMWTFILERLWYFYRVHPTEKKAIATCTGALKADYGAITLNDISHTRRSGHRSVYATGGLASGETPRFRCIVRHGTEIVRVQVYADGSLSITNAKSRWISAEPYRVEPEPEAEGPAETTPEQGPKISEVPEEISPESKTPGTGTGFKKPGTGTSSGVNTRDGGCASGIVSPLRACAWNGLCGSAMFINRQNGLPSSLHESINVADAFTKSAYSLPFVFLKLTLSKG